MEKDEKYTNTKTSSFVILIFFCIFTFSWFLKFFAISYSNYFFEAGLVFVIITTILFIIKKYDYVIRVFNVFILLGFLSLLLGIIGSISELDGRYLLFYGVMGFGYLETTYFLKHRNYKMSSIFILMSTIFGSLYYLFLWEPPFFIDYPWTIFPEYKDIIFDDFLLINWFFLTHFMIFVTILLLYSINRQKSESDEKNIDLSLPNSQ